MNGITHSALDCLVSWCVVSVNLLRIPSEGDSFGSQHSAHDFLQHFAVGVNAV